MRSSYGTMSRDIQSNTEMSEHSSHFSPKGIKLRPLRNAPISSSIDVSRLGNRNERNGIDIPKLLTADKTEIFATP
jgi:hypothetical protein